MSEKIAIIDCGTNTFHLLIAERKEDHIEILDREKIAVRIGKGGINNKIILPDAIDRATDTINRFNEVIQSLGVHKVHAFATSAFRNADNGVETKKHILKETGIDIKIISGDEEAELIFWGANAALDIGNDPALVMDIGGGSVEFIIGSKDQIIWKRSFEIGAQRLLDLFHNSDPIQQQELNDLEAYLQKELKELHTNLKRYRPKTLIGSSGTFDTLSDIFCEQEGLPKNDDASETPLTLEGYKRIHQELLMKNREERMKIPGMIEMRVDMIVVASCLIDHILRSHPFDNIRVSTYALKEGVLNRILSGDFKS